MQVKTSNSKDRKRWLVPSAVAVVTSLGAAGGNMVRMEMALNYYAAQLEALRACVESGDALGPDGFLSPAAAGQHDLHSERWHERTFGRTGWRKLLMDYGAEGAGKK